MPQSAHDSVMPPVPTDAFAREFRSLAADRVAFVAALWEARGWQTTVDDGSVVAERAGERRRIGVVDPGRFGTPELSGLDTLVVARDRDAVRSAAAEAGVAYVPPADLRELLLYGLERETAAKLYEQYVGKPLERAVPEEGEKSGGTGFSLPAIPSVEPGRRVIAAIVLVALVGVVVAGPTLPGTGSEPAPITVTDTTPDEGTVDAVGVESPSPTEAPGIAPGLSLDGVESAQTLADAHIDGVRNRSRVRSTRLAGPPNASGMGGTSQRNTTTLIVNDSRFYRHEHAVGGVGGPGGSAELETYADGGPVYQRLAVENDTRYSRYGADELSATDFDEIRGSLYRYFVGVENTVVSCAIQFDSDCPTYRLAVDEPPNALGEEVAEYEAFMIVSDRGVITTIRASYTLPDADDDGEREPVSFALDYRFEEVTVEDPDWLSDAKNATANGTETGTGGA